MPKKPTHLVLVVIFMLAGCASAPPLSDSGARVRQISTEQAKSCKFLQIVQYTDRIMGMGKNATVMKAIGETSLLNLAGSAGANGLVITEHHADWFLGNVSYRGEAFRCQ